METKSEYKVEMDDALEMIGKGYEIYPPVSVIHEGNDGLPEEHKNDAWIKLSMSFLKTLSKLRGAKLAVWFAIALRINEQYTSFPAIKTIMRDTGLSNREVIDTIKELEEIGYLSVRRGEKRHNIYKINTFAAFGQSEPVIPNGEETSQVKFTDESVKFSEGTVKFSKEKMRTSPLNTSLKQDINKKEREINKTAEKTFSLENKIFAGLPITEEDLEDSKIKHEAPRAFEAALGYGTLPWATTREWERMFRFVVDIYKSDPGAFKKFAFWQRGEGKFEAMSNKQIRMNPSAFMDTGWPAYLNHKNLAEKLQKEKDSEYPTVGL